MNPKKLFQILYEDDHLLAINKPPRIACVPADNIPIQETVLGKIERQFEEKGIKPYLLHRLDYQTSGVLMFGKHERDRQALEGILRHSETQKIYLVLVKGVPHGSIIKKHVGARHTAVNIPAKTAYEVLQVFKAPHPLCSLVEAEIFTGRRHQIRKHFASIGHPVILDSRYGDQHFNRKFRIRYRLGRLFLHCAAISFIHPLTAKKIQIKSPIPPDLRGVIKKLTFARG